MASPPPAPGEALSPALALVNTAHARGGTPTDELPDVAALTGWLVRHDLVAEGDRLTLTDADLTGTHRLRAAVRELLSARIEGRRPNAGAPTLVNAACAAVPMVAQLDWPDAGPPLSVVRAVSRAGLPCALATVAADAIDLVSGARADQLLACGAPGCIRLLVRDNARRQWCSTRCGDRVRANRYYRTHSPRRDQANLA